ncbi:Cryptochrome [Pseudoalteromonas luteoviolacea B = ATCC 29581]|nr:Cryptochrome [Pseudoalteromonas luteoviolacea B = ATCC 29581]
MKTGLFLVYNHYYINGNSAFIDFKNRYDRVIVVTLNDFDRLFSQHFAQTSKLKHCREALSSIVCEFASRVEKFDATHIHIKLDDVYAFDNIVNTQSVCEIGYNEHPSVDFKSMIKRISERYKDITIRRYQGNTLFSSATAFIKDDQFPSTFSQFRKQAESALLDYRAHSTINPSTILDSSNRSEFGEFSAQQHVLNYFASHAAQTYKQTRNALYGSLFSTRLSIFLSFGSLNVQNVLSHLWQFEANYGENDSTRWIEFELLWREYFYWYAHFYGRVLFRKRGLSEHAPLSSFYDGLFKAWCEGFTASPLVNAIMRELKSTGWISNRARQISASYLIYELGIDWRHGAAYFEQALLDYDVAINWGNWQYIAGVGADPRGGRHFNIQKQTDQFDPDGHYRRTWLTNEHQAYNFE